MAINYNLIHTYKFLKDRLTQDELVSIKKGDIPGYLKDKIDEISIVVDESGEYIKVDPQYIIDLVQSTSSEVETKFIFKRSVGAPGTPTGNDPTGPNYGDWQDSAYPSDGTKDALYMSTGKFIDAELEGTWSEPVKIDGTDGLSTIKVYKKTTTFSAPAAPTTTDPTDGEGWYLDYSDIIDWNTPGNYIWVSLAVSTDFDGTTWSSILGDWSASRLEKVIGQSKISYIFKRAESKPNTPTTLDPVPETWNYGDWKYAPYAKTDTEHKLWMSQAIIFGDTLEETWTEPIALDEPGAGYYKKIVFKSSETPLDATDRPEEEVSPIGWYDTPEEAVTAGGDHVMYASLAVIKVLVGEIDLLMGQWSIPYKWSGEDGDDGDDGVTPLAAELLPSIFAFSLDNEGNVLNLEDGAFTLKVGRGSNLYTYDSGIEPNDDTYNVEIVDETNITLESSVVDSDLVLTPTWINTEERSGSATLKITDNSDGTEIFKQYTFTNVWDGNDGISPSLLRLIADSQVFHISTDVDGVIQAEPNEINLQAVLQNLSGDATFSVDEGTATLTSIDGLNSKLEFSNMTTDKVKIKAESVEDPTCFDIVTIVKVGAGTGWTWYLTNENHTFYENEEGDIQDIEAGNSEIVGYKNITRLQGEIKTAPSSPYTYVVDSVTVFPDLGLTYSLDIVGKNFRFKPETMGVSNATVTLTITAQAEEGYIETFTKVLSYSKITEGLDSYNWHFDNNPAVLYLDSEGNLQTDWAELHSELHVYKGNTRLLYDGTIDYTPGGQAGPDPTTPNTYTITHIYERFNIGNIIYGLDLKSNQLVIKPTDHSFPDVNYVPGGLLTCTIKIMTPDGAIIEGEVGQRYQAYYKPLDAEDLRLYTKDGAAFTINKDGTVEPDALEVAAKLINITGVNITGDVTWKINGNVVSDETGLSIPVPSSSVYISGAFQRSVKVEAEVAGHTDELYIPVILDGDDGNDGTDGQSTFMFTFDNTPSVIQLGELDDVVGSLELRDSQLRATYGNQGLAYDGVSVQESPAVNPQHDNTFTVTDWTVYTVPFIAGESSSVDWNFHVIDEKLWIKLEAIDAAVVKISLDIAAQVDGELYNFPDAATQTYLVVKDGQSGYTAFLINDNFTFRVDSDDQILNLEDGSFEARVFYGTTEFLYDGSEEPAENTYDLTVDSINPAGIISLSESTTEEGHRSIDPVALDVSYRSGSVDVIITENNRGIKFKKVFNFQIQKDAVSSYNVRLNPGSHEFLVNAENEVIDEEGGAFEIEAFYGEARLTYDDTLDPASFTYDVEILEQVGVSMVESTIDNQRVLTPAVGSVDSSLRSGYVKVKITSNDSALIFVRTYRFIINKEPVPPLMLTTEPQTHIYSYYYGIIPAKQNLTVLVSLTSTDPAGKMMDLRFAKTGETDVVKDLSTSIYRMLTLVEWVEAFNEDKPFGSIYAKIDTSNFPGSFLLTFYDDRGDFTLTTEMIESGFSTSLGSYQPFTDSAEIINLEDGYATVHARWGNVELTCPDTSTTDPTENNTYKVTNITLDDATSVSYTEAIVNNQFQIQPTTLSGNRVTFTIAVTARLGGELVTREVVLRYGKVGAIKGNDGRKGDRLEHVYRQADSQPDTPSGTSPSNWYTDPTEAQEVPVTTVNSRLWMSLAYKGATGTLTTNWTEPVAIDGPRGISIEQRYKESSSQPATPTGNDPTAQGWSTVPPTEPSNSIWVSVGYFDGNNDLIDTWSSPTVWSDRASLDFSELLSAMEDDIAALQTTVQNHEDRITALET